jgi:3-deoxy-D-manno-octulosonic-acid transferase
VNGVSRPVWAHGSSAGDIMALLPVVDELEALGHPSVLSCFTKTGVAAARSRGCMRPVFRAPLDFAPIVQRSLKCIAPRLLLLECLEMWPGLVGCSLRRQIPVAIVNGRLSERSMQRYLRASALFRPLFARLSRVIALTEQDAERFARVGVSTSRLSCRSNSKHAGLPRVAISQSKPPKVVFGSLHLAELKLLLPYLSRLWAVLCEQGGELVVVPRYPARSRTFRRALAVTLGGAALSNGAHAAIRVVDRMGQLLEEYRDASVAFVGGSLIARGGHNVLEPAAFGATVITGASVENCRQEMSALVEAGCGFRASSPRQVVERLLAWLPYSIERARQSSRAVHLFRQNARASARDLAPLCHEQGAAR